MNSGVTENITERRFELPINADAIAAAYYREDDGRIILIHTEVPSEYSGHGLASRLAEGTFNLIQQSGRRVVLKCPFMAAFFVRHPEYAAIVDG
jgi:predicted GNAT family acetyltransferase